MPRAMSKAKAPVLMVGTSTCIFSSPSFIIAPLPNSFSIWLITVAIFLSFAAAELSAFLSAVLEVFSAIFLFLQITFLLYIQILNSGGMFFYIFTPWLNYVTHEKREYAFRLHRVFH